MYMYIFIYLQSILMYLSPARFIMKAIQESRRRRRARDQLIGLVY